MDKKTQLAIFGANRNYDGYLKTGQESLSLEDIVKSIIETDPTENKIYLDWIIESYIVGGFSLSDVELIKQDLLFYENHQDLMKSFHVVPTLYTVEGFHEILRQYRNGQDLEKTLICKRFLENSDIIIDNVGGISLFYHKSKGAQDYLFKETSWNEQERSGKSPYANGDKNHMNYVLIFENKKYLIHIKLNYDPDDYKSFDQQVKTCLFDKNFHILMDPLGIYRNKQNPLDLYWDKIKDHLILYSQDHPHIAPVVSLNEQSSCLYQRHYEAVFQDPQKIEDWKYRLEHVPFELRSRIMSFNAVAHDASNLGAVPDQFKTRDLCHQASLKFNPLNSPGGFPNNIRNFIYSIPLEYRDEVVFYNQNNRQFAEKYCMDLFSKNVIENILKARLESKKKSRPKSKNPFKFFKENLKFPNHFVKVKFY